MSTNSSKPNTRSEQECGLSLQPDTYVASRDMVYELGEYLKKLKKRPCPRDCHIGARYFQAHLLRWMEVVGLRSRPQATKGESCAFLLHAGAQLLLTLREIDTIGDANEVLKERGTSDELLWLRTFEPEMSANAEGRKKVDFRLSRAQAGPFWRLKEILHLPNDTIVAALSAATALLYVPFVDPETKDLLKADLRKFRRTLKARAQKADEYRRLALKRPARFGGVVTLEDLEGEE